MDKRSRDAKDKVQTNEEGTRHRREYFKPGPRDRPIARSSRRPFKKEQDYTPLNGRREEILKEVYHLKFLPKPVVPKRVYIVMGKDGSTCVHTINFEDTT